MKLANYFNRQFTDHISTFEWDNNGPDNWMWRMEPLSHATAGIVRVPMTDPMCLRTPRMLLTLNEIMEWGMHATNAGESLLEWRLMGHTMVPLCQSIGAGLEHDCSTWDEIYEDGGNDAPNAWNAPKAKASDQAALFSPRLRMLSNPAPRLSCARMRRALGSECTEQPI